MNNKYLMASFMGVVTFFATYFILAKDEEVKDKTFNTTLEKAGEPSQIENKDEADQENAEMVAEGSQFGVQYFNHLPESKKEELK